MELEGLRRARRVLSGLVALCAIALVMVKTRGSADPASGAVGLAASAGVAVSFVLLVVVWRREHAAGEAAFAERERAQLAMLRLQVELAKKRAAKATADPPPE